MNTLCWSWEQSNTSHVCILSALIPASSTITGIDPRGRYGEKMTCNCLVVFSTPALACIVRVSIRRVLTQPDQAIPSAGIVRPSTLATLFIVHKAERREDVMQRKAKERESGGCYFVWRRFIFGRRHELFLPDLCTEQQHDIHQPGASVGRWWRKEKKHAQRPHPAQSLDEIEQQ